jgi:hypothetical protein
VPSRGYPNPHGETAPARAITAEARPIPSGIRMGAGAAPTGAPRANVAVSVATHVAVSLGGEYRSGPRYDSPAVARGEAWACTSDASIYTLRSAGVPRSVSLVTTMPNFSAVYLEL